MYKLENRIGLRQFNVIKEHFFKGINRHFFRGVRGLSPANLDCRISSGNNNKVECVTSGNDSRLGRWLRAVCNLINTPHSALSCHSLPQWAREHGRSMIEMLGVLAIIGVLSVGGIAGYSKAMEKWKINKTIEQVEEITQNILTLYVNQKTFDWHEWDVLKVDNLKTLGIIPANLKQAEEDYLFINPLGGISDVFVGPDLFQIDLLDISKEACVVLSTHNWNFSSPYFLGIVARKTSSGGGPEAFGCIDIIDSQTGRWVLENYYFQACKCARTTTPEFGLPVPPEVAAKACSCKSNTCVFSIAYSLTGVNDPENCGKDIDWDEE